MTHRRSGRVGSPRPPESSAPGGRTRSPRGAEPAQSSAGSAWALVPTAPVPVDPGDGEKPPSRAAGVERPRGHRWFCFASGVDFSVMRPNPFPILLAAAMVIQSFLVGVAGAGTLCLGGGHVHPEQDSAPGCALDCSHAATTLSLAAPVTEPHPDCSCVDMDLSMSDPSVAPPRVELIAPVDVGLFPAKPLPVSLFARASAAFSARAPAQFALADRPHRATLATTCLII